jgi:hypothetical protein
MYILFSIVGGIGKCIAATAVVKVLRKTFPNHKIVVISQFPNIFKNNPNVDITHKNEEIISNMVYFKYLKNKDTKVFLQEPYEHHDMITGESHLIKTWCTMFGLEYNNEQPEIFLTNEEQKYYEPFYETDKPFFVFQSNGGMLGSDNLGQKPGFNWVRDIPEFTMKQIIEEYRDYYHIVHIKRPDQIRFDDVVDCYGSPREVAYLLTQSKKRLFNDSFGQHLAAALNLPSTVCWIGSSPKHFGYEIHDNVISNPPEKEYANSNGIFYQYQLWEDIVDMPYENQDNIFDVDKIIQSLNK